MYWLHSVHDKSYKNVKNFNGHESPTVTRSQDSCTWDLHSKSTSALEPETT